MYTIDNSINSVEYNALNVTKLLNISAKEILHVSLEANAEFPKHSASSDVHILVLEGEILFFVNHKEYKLGKHQIFNFPKNEEHWVKAIQNSKFLIIR